MSFFDIHNIPIKRHVVMEQSLQTHVRNSSIALKKCHVIDVRLFNEIKCFLKDKNRIHAVNIYVHPTM